MVFFDRFIKLFKGRFKLSNGYEVVSKGRRIVIFSLANELVFPPVDSINLSSIISKISHYPRSNLAKIVGSYRKKDLKSFSLYFRKLIESRLVKLIEENINYFKDGDTIIVVYTSESVGVADYTHSPFLVDTACIVTFNIPKIINELLEEGESGVDTTIMHELVHILDRKKISEKRVIANRFNYLISKEAMKYCNNSYLIFYYFYQLRIEGISTFLSNLKTGKPINMLKEYLEHFSLLMVVFCQKFDKIEVDKISNMFQEYGLAYGCGTMMLSIIVISALFKNGKRFSAWIRTDGITSKDVNAVEISDYFNKVSFKIYFNKEDVPWIADFVLKDVKEMSHILFLKEYETACSYLNLNPIITFEFYNRVKIDCFKNFMKYKSAN